MKIALPAAIGVATLLAIPMMLQWERPPMDSVQQGYRGNGMVQIDNPRMMAIKKAAKSEKEECLTVFRILVTDNKAKKVKVKLTLPITLVNWSGDHCHGRIDLGDGCHLDLGSIVKKLKRGKSFSILEIDDGDETVKIWFE